MLRQKINDVDNLELESKALKASTELSSSRTETTKLPTVTSFIFYRTVQCAQQLSVRSIEMLRSTIYSHQFMIEEELTQHTAL